MRRHAVVLGIGLALLAPLGSISFRPPAAFAASADDPDHVLMAQLQRNDIADALHTAPTTSDPDDAYASIAAQQTKTRDFAGARRTIRRITVGDSHHAPRPGLVARCRALTDLAAGFFAVGRANEARAALHVASLDATKIPNIFAEMGEGYGPRVAERWIDIADVQLIMRDRRSAKRSLDIAERFAAGSHLGFDATSVLARIEKDRRALGDSAGAVRARRERRLAAANSITDIGVKAEALVDVDAEDGNTAGVLETVRQYGGIEDPVELLCHGVRTINRIQGDKKCRERLLQEARKLARQTKDPKVRLHQEDMIAKAAGGAENAY
jgi:hypothetical protein